MRSTFFLLSLPLVLGLEAVQTERFTVKHREFNGVGYDSGYTSVDAFFAKSLGTQHINLLDVRTHFLNNGNFGLNAGLGWRYFVDTKLPVLLGINGYYDYRINRGVSFNQLGLGFEALHSRFEARLNGYLPIGAQYQPSGTSVGDFVALHFYQHYLVIAQPQVLDFTSSLGGIDSEFGAHFWPTSKKDLDLYVGVGPYYLQMPHSSAAAGVAARAALSMSRYITATGFYSYDRFYKNIGQMEISFNIPFYQEKDLDAIDHSRNADLIYFFQERATQDVYRHEIIPTRTTHSGDDHGIHYAINPLTNLPYYFVFVNNTNHTNPNGTYENPYPTLLEAQNNSDPYDIIYIYPGDGTTTGMDGGIALQDHQWVFGASISHPIQAVAGLIVIPPLATTMPTIDNTIGDAIQLANNNLISGMHLDTTGGFAIFGNGIENIEIERNNFSGLNGTAGIGFEDAAGIVDVHNNQFSNYSQAGGGLFMELDISVVSQFNLIQNTFNGFDLIGSGQSFGCFVHLKDGTVQNALIRGNSFENFGVSGPSSGAIALQFAVDSGFLEAVTVTDNTFTNFDNGSIGFNLYYEDAVGTINVSNCTFLNLDNGAEGIGFITDPGGTLNAFNVDRCSFTNISNDAHGIDILFEGGDAQTITVTNTTVQNVSATGRGMSFGATSGTLNSLFVDRFNVDQISGAYGCAGRFISGGIEEITFQNSVMTNLSGTALGFAFQNDSTISFAMDVANNQFFGPGLQGWGVGIRVTNGDLCLSITGNTATPLSSAPNQPFYLDRTGGIFTYDSQNNQGTFTVTGATPGVCP